MSRPSSAKPRPNSLGVLILAAGEGTRMESSLPKVLHPVGGRPMLSYPLRAAQALKPHGIGIVVGHQAETVQKAALEMNPSSTRPIAFIRQKHPTGSGGAVLEAVGFLKKFQTAIVLCGDTPLLGFETLSALLQYHRQQKGQVTLLSARLANPKGYGRVVRSPTGDVLRIVEETEASPKEAAISEINSGAYCFEAALLLKALEDLRPNGPKRERYLTDALELIRRQGGRITAYLSSNPEEALGINTRIQLSQAERVLNRRHLERLMLSGVTVIDPMHTYVDADVEVGRDSVLLPGTLLRGKTRVGKNCVIGPFCFIENSAIEDGCRVRSSHIADSRILEGSAVGPFAHMRGGAVVGPKARIGNFSELKNSRVGAGSKVPHLSYIGDTEMGPEVNIGAGTITCNYDGVRKNKTLIGAKAFVGSNVNLVAPVRVGRGAKIGAGSTITEDVPDGVLAIARARQENKVRK